MARALLHNASIYIFDEATSNIDAQSEGIIYNVVQTLAQTKTVILISHRLANVVQSDTIFVLDKGNLIEQGTHEELLAQGKTYANLYMSQQNLENIFKGGSQNA